MPVKPYPSFVVGIGLLATSVATLHFGYEYGLDGLPPGAREVLVQTGEDQILALPWTALSILQLIAAIVFLGSASLAIWDRFRSERAAKASDRADE